MPLEKWYKFLEASDAWAEREGWIDWIVTGWNKLVSFFDNQTILSTLIFLIIFLQFIIILYLRRNLSEVENRAFNRGWRAKEKDA